MKKILKLVCVCLLLTGCSVVGDPKPENIVLKDHLGREVVLEEAVDSVVSSYYISTTTLISLDADDLLVGVEMKANEREIYHLAAPELLDLPAMGNKKNFNIEECAKLNPDLVILPMSLKDYVSQLEELSIPVVVVNPETMEGFLDTVMLLGKATAHEKEAEELLTYYEETIKKIDDQVNEETKTVYFSSGKDILKSATNKMFQAELVKNAKGENVASDLNDTNWSAISAEQLIKYDPDYIFMENRSESFVEDLYEDERFSSLSAVSNKHVYTFPSLIETWDTPSSSSILGILWLSSVLYPESISMEEVREEAIAFYQNFFDIEVSAEQLGI